MSLWIRHPTWSPALRCTYVANLLYCRLGHRVEPRGGNPIPPPGSGGGIVVANHTSHLDPFFIQSVVSRHIVWMMTSDFYDLPYLGLFFRLVGAIRVSQSGRDTTALRAAIRTLESGGLLGIFPEGRISPTADLLPFQAGVAQLALRTGSPVYPIRLDGTQRNTRLAGAFLARHRATLRFGPPIAFSAEDPDREALRRATAQIEQAIRALQPPCVAKKK